MILTLQTNAFGWHGGIPGYNRLVCRVLNSIASPQSNRVLIAMDDPQAVAVESSALTNLKVSAFAGKRSAFVRAALSAVIREPFDLVLAGHVNYAPLCVMLKLLRPQLRFGVFVYGLEVWEKMPWLRRWSLQQADFVISISDYTKAQAAELNGLKKERILILPNALEWTNDIAASSIGNSLSEGTKLLSVGRLDSNEQRKGFDTVIESLPAVVKQVPDVQYLIVGVGSDLERHKVLAATVGVSDRVHFLGAVDQAALQDCYRSCDLFVMPSAQEGFGFVYLEAMQYQKAVVAANSGGAPEVVEDGVTGRLVEYGNQQQLAGALTDLLTQPDLCGQMGRAGYQKLQEKFTFSHFKETLTEILRQELPPEKTGNAGFAPLKVNSNNQGTGVAREDELAPFSPGTEPPQSDSFRKDTRVPLAEAVRFLNGHGLSPVATANRENSKQKPSNQRQWQEVYLERFYPQTSWRRDGTRDFFQVLQGYCGGEILEIGAGPANPTSDHLRTLGNLHGIDVDAEVLQNPALKTSSVIEDRFPFPEGTFDSCVSNYVCEHLDDPQQHLEEVWRVLKPGGAYVFRTPNRLHYIAIVSSLTPHSFHLKAANKLRAIDGHDPYPTRYRLNSRAQIQRLARKTGFEVEYLRLVEKEPSYGMSSRLLFLLFTAYERVVNASELLAIFRSNLFVVLRKSRKAPTE